MKDESLVFKVQYYENFLKITNNSSFDLWVKTVENNKKCYRILVIGSGKSITVNKHELNICNLSFKLMEEVNR